MKTYTMIIKKNEIGIISFELESYFTCGEIGITNCIKFKLTYKLQLKIFNYKNVFCILTLILPGWNE
jgi:hypothetical protein